MVRRSFRLPWRFILSSVLILVLAGVVALLYGQWRERPPEPQLAALPPTPVYSAADAPALADTLYARAELTLEELGIWADLIHKTRGDPDQIEVRVPADLSLLVVNLHITRFVDGGGGRVLRAIESVPGQRVEMFCGFDSVATTLFLLQRERGLRRRVGQIAIVLDDFGYMSRDESLIEHFCALSQPLTFVALPDEGKVAEIVDLAQSHGHQVILHLPMGPEDSEKNPGEGAIRIDQVDDPQAIESRLWDLAALAARSGQAVGIGHDRQNTLLALRAVLPRLEMRGFHFVLLSQLAR